MFDRAADILSYKRSPYELAKRCEDKDTRDDEDFGQAKRAHRTFISSLLLSFRAAQAAHVMHIFSSLCGSSSSLHILSDRPSGWPTASPACCTTTIAPLTCCLSTGQGECIKAQSSRRHGRAFDGSVHSSVSRGVLPCAHTAAECDL